MRDEAMCGFVQCNGRHGRRRIGRRRVDSRAHDQRPRAEVEERTDYWNGGRVPGNEPEQVENGERIGRREILGRVDLADDFGGNASWS
jgi:hypothetical protein